VLSNNFSFKVPIFVKFLLILYVNTYNLISGGYLGVAIGKGTKLTPKEVKRIHWLVTMALVLVVAMLAAKLLSAIVGMALVDVKPSNAPKYSKTKVMAEQNLEAQRLAKYDVIITRNLFNSKNEIPEDLLITSVPGEATRVSTLDVELVGTIVVNDPSRSVAAISLKALKKVDPFLIGDVVLSKVSVYSIARRKVVFKDLTSGELEYIEMKGDDYATGAPVSAVPAGVKQLGEGKLLLDKSELNRSLTDINSLLSQARAVPNFENGVISGFKLFDVQPGSLYQKLGAQNGDIIKSVNGVDIKDPATAMGMFQKIQTTNKLDFVINRGGETKNYSVEIR
jgi:general secretion pathway protein C